MPLRLLCRPGFLAFLIALSLVIPTVSHASAASRIASLSAFHSMRHPRQLDEYGRNRDQHASEGVFLSPGRLAGNAASAYQHAGRTHNQERCSISWQFTTNEARLKLTHLYPNLQNGRKTQA